MLNVRRLRFVDEYLIHKDAAKAAIAAGYSRNGAAVRGFNLLKRDDVRQEINRRTAKISQSADITAVEILQRLDRIARTAEDSGDTNAAIRANELLGKHLKLFTDKVDHSVQGQLQVQIVSEFPDE